MPGIRSLSRWTSLFTMILGAAVSTGVSVIIAACGGDDDETNDGGTAIGDAGSGDARNDQTNGPADAAEDDAMDSSNGTSDVNLVDQASDIVPTDDVSLDSVPAE